MSGINPAKAGVKPKRSGFEILGIMFVGFAMLVVNAILRGLVVKILWNWFVVRLGVIAINIPEAIGIAILIQLLTSKTTADDNERTGLERFFMEFFINLTLTGFALLFGWIVHFFL